MSFVRASLYGFDFIKAVSVQEVAEDIIHAFGDEDGGRLEYLITPNASTITYYSQAKHKQLKNFYSKSAYILPDGMPVVWMSKLISKTKLEQRLTGSDLFPTLWEMVKEKTMPVSMVLANENLAELFRADLDTASIHVPKMFSADDEAYMRSFAGVVADDIIAHGSRLLFLGLNFPKQELLGIYISEALQQKGYKKGMLTLLLGASYEFYFGLKERAPQFYQRNGLEWLYRFAKEPRRLGKRYTVDNIRFLGLSIKELFKKRTA